MDLFGPSRIKSYRGNYYALFIVDDYSRFTWTFFLTLKSEAFEAFKKFAKLVQNEKYLKIKIIRSDHGRKFQNESLKIFVMKMEFCITSLHLGHLNIMEL